MADTLLEAHRIAAVARDQGRAALSGNEIRIIGRLYTGALARARTGNPASDTTVLADTPAPWAPGSGPAVR